MTDLKIKDVAELLSISETTVRRWLTDRKIPAYRINHQFRFSRTEIEDWVMSQKIGREDSLSPFNSTTQLQKDVQPITEVRARTKGSHQFSLYRALNNGGVYLNVPGTGKEEVLRNTVNLLAHPLNLDPAVLSELLLDREKLMPTGLNNGIGMPHARDFLLNSHRDVVVLAFPEKPIYDYGSLDGKPVHALFFLFATEDKIHLHLLAKIAHLVGQKEAIELLQSKPSKKEILTYIRQWEASINS